MESDDLLSFATSPKILINDNFIIPRTLRRATTDANGDDFLFY